MKTYEMLAVALPLKWYPPVWEAFASFCSNQVVSQPTAGLRMVFWYSYRHWWLRAMGIRNCRLFPIADIAIQATKTYGAIQGHTINESSLTGGYCCYKVSGGTWHSSPVSFDNTLSVTVSYKCNVIVRRSIIILRVVETCLRGTDKTRLKATRCAKILPAWRSILPIYKIENNLFNIFLVQVKEEDHYLWCITWQRVHMVKVARTLR